MRNAWWVLVLVACDRDRPAPAPVVERPAAAPITVDATQPIDAAPPDAMTLAVPARITRRVETGMITTAHDAETFALQIDGTRALLTIDLFKGKPKDMLGSEIASWDHVSTTQLAGTATIEGKTTKLALGTWNLTCETARLAVANAGAVRKPSPPRANSEGCGDTGRWVPRGTTKVEVLRCALPDDFDPDDTHPRHWTNMPALAFAAAPGIEWVYVNDDCAMQGGDWRRIANDGSIAPVR